MRKKAREGGRNAAIGKKEKARRRGGKNACVPKGRFLTNGLLNEALEATSSREDGVYWQGIFRLIATGGSTEGILLRLGLVGLSRESSVAWEEEMLQTYISLLLSYS